MLSSLIFLPALGGFANAANLWATHYSGTANWLTFDGSSLKVTTQSSTNNRMPSWITYDKANKALYLPKPVPFDFLVRGEILQGTLEEWCAEKGIGEVCTLALWSV